MAERVAVLGGGVGGMTAAHELAERGFAVSVFEARHIAGGKARSVPVPKSGTDGRADLPGEHGFRFFPGFYRHVPDTMQRIPYAQQPRGVLDNLRVSTRAELAQANKPAVVLPAQCPIAPSNLRLTLHDLLHTSVGIPDHEFAYFVERLLVLLTSCEARRYAEYEYESWWEFSGAASRSPAYQKFLADGLTRSLVAARARKMSARTGGYILLQLLLDLGKPGDQVDRVLDGPTNDVWITPWFDHLRSLGVEYQFGHEVVAVACTGNRITSVTVRDHRGHRAEISADYYVAAVPVEHMRTLVTHSMTRAEPRLAHLNKLVTRWMNGILFYLHEDVPIVHGHSIYIDSPWSLTSISQRQFWDGVDFAQLGDGRVSGILSVDVSEWQEPGILYGKKAMDCTLDEIRSEVWAQLQAHLDIDGSMVLADENLNTWFLDRDVRFPDIREDAGVRKDINLEPLLVNTKGSWDFRPEAVTAIENLFLASDYVRTHTDLACMEGANEAARRAVNGILEAAGSPEPPCEVWPLHEPVVFAPFREIDKVRFERGQPHQRWAEDEQGFPVPESTP